MVDNHSILILNKREDMEKILVTRPSIPSLEEYNKELQEIWESKWLTNMGPKHNEFKQILLE